MNVSFQLKKSKADNLGLVPIYVRITVNGLRTEFSIKKSVEPQRWLSSSGVIKGNSEECKSLNAFLATVRQRLNEHYRTLLEANQVATTEARTYTTDMVTNRPEFREYSYDYKEDEFVKFPDPNLFRPLHDGHLADMAKRCQPTSFFSTKAGELIFVHELSVGKRACHLQTHIVVRSLLNLTSIDTSDHSFV